MNPSRETTARRFTPVRMLIAAAVFLAASQAAVMALEIYPYSSGLGEFGAHIAGFYLITALFVAAFVCLLVSWVRRHELGSRRWLHRVTAFAVVLPLLNLIYFTWLPTAERLAKAARLGEAEVVARCLFWGIEPDATYVAAAGFGGRGETRPPLELAASGGHVDVMTLLLDAGADINANRSAALVSAVGTGQALAVEVLLDRGADLARAVDVATRPTFGTRSGQLEALQRLLRRRPDVLGGPGLLVKTAYDGAPKVAREIAAMDVAGRYGPVYELLRQLALEGPTEAAYRVAAASLITPSSEQERLQALQFIQYRRDHRDIELTSLTGEVILNLAVKFGDRTLSAALLADGVPAEPPIDDRLQLLTPLHRAIYQDRLDLARTLIAAGADLNRPNRTFGRPLHLAVQSGSIAMLKLLIDAGAPLEAPETEAGTGTALFVAVHFDDLERTRVLIQAGADPHATGWGIGTACDLARDKAAVGAYMASVCGAAPSVPESASLDASLQSLADEAGLAIIDVSVPFERLALAPAQLKAVSGALETGSSGVYVMRYADDTLRQTLHVFVIATSKRVYVKLSMTPHENLIQEQHDIHASRYEEKAESLILDTSAGVIRLTPQDVTPFGA